MIELARLLRTQSVVERMSSREEHGSPFSMRLNYSLASDVYSATAWAGGVFNIISPQNFTIQSKSAIAVIEFGIGLLIHQPTLGNVALARIVVDGLAQNWGPPNWTPNSYHAPRGRTYSMKLAQGVHTIYAQAYTSAACQLWLRAASVGVYEYLTIQVDEYPQ